jgi:hypothetical protein
MHGYERAGSVGLSPAATRASTSAQKQPLLRGFLVCCGISRASYGLYGVCRTADFLKGGVSAIKLAPTSYLQNQVQRL